MKRDTESRLLGCATNPRGAREMMETEPTEVVRRTRTLTQTPFLGMDSSTVPVTFGVKF